MMGKKIICVLLLLISCKMLTVHATAAQQQTTSPPTSSSSQKTDSTSTEPQEETLKEKLTIEDSILEERREQQVEIARNPLGVAFDEPTYLLPFYYTSSPYQAIYRGQTPDNQSVNNLEFKFRLSLLFPIWANIVRNMGLYASYTQLSYWQFYSKSQYFRETDYKPALFLRGHVLANGEWRMGIVHQSNGRGGDFERSWNRFFIDLRLSGEKWMVSFKPWILIFKNDSSNLYNPNIADYLGHSRLVLAYNFHGHKLSLMVRNAVESGFRRGTVQLGWNFPIIKQIRGYVQLFSGYGQSLIEYDHYTNSVGIGLILSDWI